MCAHRSPQGQGPRAPRSPRRPPCARTPRSTRRNPGSPRPSGRGFLERLDALRMSVGPCVPRMSGAGLRPGPAPGPLPAHGRRPRSSFRVSVPDGRGLPQRSRKGRWHVLFSVRPKRLPSSTRGGCRRLTWGRATFAGTNTLGWAEATGCEATRPFSPRAGTALGRLFHLTTRTFDQTELIEMILLPVEAPPSSLNSQWGQATGMGPRGTDPSTHVSCTPHSKLVSRFIWGNLSVAPRLTRRVFQGCLIGQ